MKIHHNTAKKAKKAGIELVVYENTIDAIKDGKVLASGMFGNKVLEEAIAKLEAKAPKAPKAPKAKKARKPRDEDGDEEGSEDEAEEVTEDEEGEGEEGGKSVVKKVYKTRYKPFKMTCGDDLSQLISKHVKVKNEDGKLRIDAKVLKAFARANGVWDPNYENLNIGMRRMNIANRLRAKVKAGHEVVWAS